MPKITLSTIASTTDVSLINSNFQKLSKELNDKVLYRDNPSGQSNTLKTPIDANGQQIINLPKPLYAHQAARLGDIQYVLGMAEDAAEAAVSALAASEVATVAAGTAVNAANQALDSTAGVAEDVAMALAISQQTNNSVEKFLAQEVRLLDFIPEEQRSAILSGTSQYDASDDITEAIAFCGSLPNGAELIASRGKFRADKAIPFKNNVVLRGNGKNSTIFEFTNIDDGFVSENPINSSTSANIGLKNLSITNTNSSNIGGGFVDVGGSYVYLDTVKISNFKYGTVLDQSEHVAISKCEYVANTTGGVWLVNGPTHTVGALNAFTNQITIHNTQFNVNGIGIIDDGGVSHSFDENNFNGGTIAMRIAGARVVSICRNEIEYCTTEGIRLTGSRQSDGTGVGQSFEVAIEKNFFIATLNTPCIAITNGVNVTLRSNDYQTTGASSSYAVVGCNNVNGLVSEASTQTLFVDTLDSIPSKLLQTDPPFSGMRFTRTQFYSPANTDTSLETYAPSSSGGGTAIGGIDLSANNSASTKVAYAKVRPAIYGNTAGDEAGGLHIELSVGGTSALGYSFIDSSFRPGADNVKTLGQANLRWSDAWLTQIHLTPGVAPASATAAGVAGEIRVVSGFIYVCVANNTWQRSALTSW